MGTPLCPHATGQPAASQEENRGFGLCHNPESSQCSAAQLSLPLEGVDNVCQLVPRLVKVWTLRAGNPQESKGDCASSGELESTDLSLSTCCNSF